jgi:hypothetical protein
VHATDRQRPIEPYAALAILPGGGIDRVLRIPAGLALIALALAGVIGPWGRIGVVPLLTGLVRFCPVYPLLGLSTCPTRKA